MKQSKKEWTLCLSAGTILVVALLLFFKGIETKKTTGHVDMYALIPADCHALVQINQPEKFENYLKRGATGPLFQQHIPTGLIALIQDMPSGNPCILAFHKQGILFCTKTDPRQHMDLKKIFSELSAHYPSQTQTFGGTEIHYYPIAENRFVGYYRRNGVLVASFSKKLLEKSILRQINIHPHRPAPWDTLHKEFNPNMAFNLLFPVKSLHLHFVTDSTRIKIDDNCWIATDISDDETNICCYGSTRRFNLPDSLYTQLEDTVSNQLQAIFPRFAITTRLNTEEDPFIFYTVCATSGISTVNPSNE